MFLLSRILSLIVLIRRSIVILFCREMKIRDHVTVWSNIVANETKHVLYTALVPQRVRPVEAVTERYVPF